MTQVCFQNVVKEFSSRETAASRERVVALRNLSLTINSGEFFTFVGPSGCGKSTTLSLIAGLEQPSSGELLFDGRAVTSVAPKERDVAMVFQSYALYPHLSVFDNIAFPLQIRRHSRSEQRAAVEAVSTTLGLQELLQRKPRELSGGQRQRVALARALVRRPRVFLMDEPLSNLDARLRLEMRAEIRRLFLDERITTVYVTHDQEEAMVLSDRLAVMRSGRIEQCDTPLKVYKEPATQFVAEFIGSPPTNFIDGVRAVELFPGLASNLPAPADDVVVGIRPGLLSVSKDSEADGAAVGCSGKLRLVETTGADSWAHVECGSALLRARVPVGEIPADGSRVGVKCMPSDFFFFAASDGRRLAVQR